MQRLVEMRADLMRVAHRWFCNCAAAIAVAIFITIFNGSAVAQTWLLAPAPVSCAPFTFFPNTTFASIPDPIVSAATYRLAFRGLGRLDQYFVEQIPGGIRLNLRVSEPDNGLANTTCSILEITEPAPSSGTLKVELYEFGNDGFGRYDVGPSIAQRIISPVPPAQPAPALGFWAVILLILILLVVAKRKLKVLASLFIFQLLTPPPFYFHI